MRLKPRSLRARIFLLPILLAIPVILLSGIVVNGEIDKAQVLAAEIKGARALAPFPGLLILFLRRQDAAHASAQKASNGGARLDELSRRIEEQIKSAEEAVRGDENVRIQQQWKRIHDDWRKISAPTKTLSREEVYSLHRSAVENTHEMIRVIAEESGLMEDADKTTYNALFMLLVQWPILAEGVGEMRTIGLDVRSRGAVLPEETRRLENTFDELQRTARSSDRSLEVAVRASSPNPFPSTARLEPIEPAIERLITRMQTQILSGADPGSSFDQEMSNAERMLDEYASVLSKEITLRLNARYAAAQVKGSVVLVGAGLVLVLVFVFVYLLLRSTASNIDNMILTSESFGKGDLKHRYRRQGVTEIDRVGFAFNRMADRLQKTFALVSRSDTLIKNIFDSAPVLIIVKDSALRWTMLNKAASEILENLYGKPPAYFLGKTDAEMELDLTRFYGETNPEKGTLESIEMRALAGELVQIESERRSGSRGYLRLEASPQRDGEGRIHGIVLNIRDISAEKRSLARQKELENQLEQKQRMETVGTLASGLAHDFNNILGVILLNSDMLEDHVRGTPGTDGLERIRAATKRAREVIRKMLTFARRIEYAPSPITLVDEVREAVPLIMSAASPNVILVEELPKAGVWIRADRAHVLQVVLNLGLNAVHAMGEAGGKLTLRVDHVRLDRTHGRISAGTYGRLIVMDTGPGVPEEIEHRIFEPFFTTKGPGEGSGLGLSTALGIVESHGGSITYEKGPGGGACFTVLLPADIAPPAGIPAIGTRSDFVRLEDARILFVDDDSAYRAAMAATLSGFGCKVEVFSTPEAALEWVQNGGKCDAAVLDFSMPGMNGVELLDRIRRWEPDLPALISSGRFDPPGESQPMNFRYLAKPCTASEVKAALSRLLERGALDNS